MRAASTDWMLIGSSPSSSPAPTATSCSTNSGLPSARCAIRVASAPRAKTLGELTGMRNVERLEFENAAMALRRGPGRPRLEQLRARQADDQDR